MAPMVHWPEVMVSYEASEKILFSADAFGTFRALNGNLFNDDVDFEKTGSMMQEDILPISSENTVCRYRHF